MVKVRKATKKDVCGLKKIDLFGDQLNNYSGLDALDPRYKGKEDEKSYYETFISGKKKWCLVAEEETGILGFILFQIEKRPDYFKIKRVGYIDLVFVAEKARGRGISQRLMHNARGLKTKELSEEKREGIGKNQERMKDADMY